MSNKDEYIEFTMEVPMIVTTKEKVKVEVEESEDVKSTHYSTETKTRRAVAIIGDRFMKGMFLPAKELEKIYTAWEGTLHDINHMGTTHLMGLGASSDIRFFVGYQKNVAYDSNTKEVSMDIHINENTLYGEALLSYIKLCEDAGNIPNVSVAFLGKVGKMQARDLPEGVNYTAMGFDADDEIQYIYDIRPRALSTVLMGACNDKDGCGIHSKCNTDNCKLSDKDYEKRRDEIIKKLKQEDKKNE